jgi:hypothetical protein
LLILPDVFITISWTSRNCWWSGPLVYRSMRIRIGWYSSRLWCGHSFRRVAVRLTMPHRPDGSHDSKTQEISHAYSLPYSSSSIGKHGRCVAGRTASQASGESVYQERHTAASAFKKPRFSWHKACGCGRPQHLPRSRKWFWRGERWDRLRPRSERQNASLLTAALQADAIGTVERLTVGAGIARLDYPRGRRR